MSTVMDVVVGPVLALAFVIFLVYVLEGVQAVCGACKILGEMIVGWLSRH